jgi:putative transcriptional regulator
MGMINYKMKAARAALGYSQEFLAKQIGVSRQTILLIEQGEYNPSLRLCCDICRALKKTLNDLFWEESNHER